MTFDEDIPDAVEYIAICPCHNREALFRTVPAYNDCQEITGYERIEIDCEALDG